MHKFILCVFLDRWRLLADHHLRLRSSLRLSSRCYRISWVTLWKRLMGSLYQGRSRTVNTSHGWNTFLPHWAESLLYEFHTTAGTPEEQIQDQEPPRSDLFLFPDESGNCQDSSPPYPMLPSPLITPAPNLAQETDDFCILETPSSRGEVGTYSFFKLRLHIFV